MAFSVIFLRFYPIRVDSENVVDMFDIFEPSEYLLLNVLATSNWKEKL